MAEVIDPQQKNYQFSNTEGGKINLDKLTLHFHIPLSFIEKYCFLYFLMKII